MYRTLRYGDFSYEIPVIEKGIYTVRLHFSEINFTSGETGKRVFNVSIEDGQYFLTNYDINADAGPMTAVVKTFTGVEVYDGYVSIDLATVVRNAIISGIEIIKEVNIVSGLDSESFDNYFNVYPNPSEGIFNIELNKNNYSLNNIPYVVYDIAGKIVFRGKIDGINTIVDLSNKEKGLYIIKIVGDNNEVSSMKFFKN